MAMRLIPPMSAMQRSFFVLHLIDERTLDTRNTRSVKAGLRVGWGGQEGYLEKARVTCL